MRYARKRGMPLDTPWRDLSQAQRRWVLEGEDDWVSWKKSWPGTWYGVRRFFNWLETKAYKMHIRVLLSRYRAYTACTACGGARLKARRCCGGSARHDAAARRASARFDRQGVAVRCNAGATAGSACTT